MTHWAPVTTHLHHVWVATGWQQLFTLPLPLYLKNSLEKMHPLDPAMPLTSIM
jgi:hypothetical protein